MTRDSSGNLYGTTVVGGTAGWGAVYLVNAAGQETVLPCFPGAPGGTNPRAGVIRDAAGNLYGTTHFGGRVNAGVVYKLDAAGRETVLYSFNGGADGRNPSAGVIADGAGNLYGTTALGGTVGYGVVYKLDTAGHEAVLYSFTGRADGGYPWGGVIRDSAGNLYGTTSKGGTGSAGVVFKLDSSGQETVLYSFTGGADGGYPTAGVIRDSAGNLYGTTTYGGTGWGVVYKADAAGHETVLYTFMGLADGGYPEAGVIRDSAGNLYGTTVSGGTDENGVVYKLDVAGQETVLHAFTGADGRKPYASVILDAAGNLYGTTQLGGTGAGANGYGVVYRIDTAGHETVLHSFTGRTDGGWPFAGVIRDSTGNLYGTTYIGGKTISGLVAFWGVVFQIKPQ